MSIVSTLPTSGHRASMMLQVMIVGVKEIEQVMIVGVNEFEQVMIVGVKEFEQVLIVGVMEFEGSVLESSCTILAVSCRRVHFDQ